MDTPSFEEKMTQNEIAVRVNAIRREAEHDDSVTPHIMEKRLWEDVLTDIASGKIKVPSLAARECMKTLEINFTRSFA